MTDVTHGPNTGLPPLPICFNSGSMYRPFSSLTADDLAGIAASAQPAEDRHILGLLLHELSFRNTTKAFELRSRLTSSATQRTSAAQPGNGSEAAPHSNVGVGQKAATSKLPSTGAAASAGKSQGRKPTPEQDQAIQLFKAGGSLKINAYAGTGKTSTLEMLSHSSSRRGQYLAFNRDIVADAKKRFPRTVNCATTHGLAFRAIAPRYGGNADKLTGKTNANQLAQLLQLQDARLDQHRAFKRRSQGSLILETVRRFAMSAAAEPLPEHVPLHGNLITASEAVRQAVRDFAVHRAKVTWDCMCDANNALPLGHDGYLKLWTLSKPVIGADFILLDEAQDTNPAVLDVLHRQPCQLVYVGDKYQQIYEWRGAVNAMDEMAADASTYLTMSFRFGPAIAEAATQLLVRMGESRPLTGNPALRSRIREMPDAGTVLSRTNASTISTIVEALDAGRRPHLVGGSDELMRMLEGVSDLKKGEPSTVPDFFGFTNWAEVVEFVRSGEAPHLQTFVRMVEERGERQLMWALRRASAADGCDLVVSTAHRAKGREWPTVRLTDDFFKPQPQGRREVSAEEQTAQESSELRLLYVAMTRARESIELPPSVMNLIKHSSPGSQATHVSQPSLSAKLADAPRRIGVANSASVTSLAQPPAQSTTKWVSAGTATPQPAPRDSRESVANVGQAEGWPPLVEAPATPKRKGLLGWLLGS